MGEVEPYMDEKWKLSKKGSRNGRSTASSSRRGGPAGGVGVGVVGGGGGGGEALLRRSDSAPARSSFSRKCASLVKEQRARFYIMRRCVTMLVCWRDR